MPPGEELALGEMRMVVLPRRHRTIMLYGGLLPVAVAVLGGTVAVAAPPGAIKLVSALVSGGLAVLGALIVGPGVARSAVTPRLCLCAGGLVEISSDEPEPRVLRWDDLETVTVGSDGCALRSR